MHVSPYKTTRWIKKTKEVKKYEGLDDDVIRRVVVERVYHHNDN